MHWLCTRDRLQLKTGELFLFSNDWHKKRDRVPRCGQRLRVLL